MKLAIIVAVAENGAIGKDNQLLWRLPDDLKRFKQLTMGSPIIMGRKTFDSIGKPLPGRTSIVISRSAGSFPGGVIGVTSIEEAVEQASQCGADTAFVIGGGEIYRLFLPIVDKIYLTKVHTSIEGDTYFKIENPEEWKEVHRDVHEPDDRHGLAFEFVDLEKLI
jgi:dihydrofolate reductase